jgi:hypothetical protein
MALLSLTPSDASSLVADACAAIRQGHDDAWNDIVRNGVRRPQWEPRFVAHLCGAMVDVAARWRSTLRAAYPSVRLSATAVFTHQTPYVKWSTNRCELADLMLAFIDRTAPTQNGTAVLIQAKQSDRRTIALSGRSEKTQFDLLSRRPTFDVDQSPAPTVVDLRSRNPDVGLLYGLTPPDATPSNPPIWSGDRWHTSDQLASIAPPYGVNAQTCLANTLVQMLTGAQGWKFDLPPLGQTWAHFVGPACRDDWSMLINFLLEKTFATPLTSLQPAIGGSARGSDHAMYLQGSTASRRTTFLRYLWSADPRGPLPLSWIAPDQLDAQRWFSVSNSPLHELGAGGGGRDGTTDEPGDPGWENGPISAVVFEL